MSVRHFRETDGEAINRLFEEVFHKRRSETAWHWKFFGHPDGPALVLIDEEAGDIVGHLAALPRRAKVSGQELIIAPRADTMVSPRYQGRGIYKSLLAALSKEAKARNISYLYGFPNPKEKDLLGGFYFQPVIDIPRLMRVNRPSSLIASRLPKGQAYRRLLTPLDCFWRSGRRRKAAQFAGHLDGHVQEMFAFGEEADRLWEAVSPGLTVAVRRDSRFLNWRYRDNLDFSYRILGYFAEGKDEIKFEGVGESEARIESGDEENQHLCGYVVLSLREKEAHGVHLKVGYLVDMLAVEEEAVWQALIDAAAEYLQEADLISAWALPHMRFYGELKKAGFAHPDSPMTLVGWALNETAAPLMQGENWYFTMGDTDSF